MLLFEKVKLVFLVVMVFKGKNNKKIILFIIILKFLGEDSFLFDVLLNIY